MGLRCALIVSVLLALPATPACSGEAALCDDDVCNEACVAAGYPSGACSSGECRCLSWADGDGDVDGDADGDMSSDPWAEDGGPDDSGPTCSAECGALGESSCLEGLLRSCMEGAEGCLVWGEPTACPSGACSSDRACEPLGDGGVVWLLHLSDTHFGETANAARDLPAFFDDVVPVVEPAIVVHSGDVTDGGSALQWGAYRAAIDGRAPDYPRYFEIPGNHDVKDDHAGNFLSTSTTGRAGGGMHGQTFVDTPAGPVRLVRANTSDSSLNPVNIAGIFGDAQADELLALPDGALPEAFSVVVAHHPITGLERLRLGAARMEAVIDTFDALLYLCGHVHAVALSWLGTTLVVQASSFGQTSPASFMLVSVDGTGPNARSITFPVAPWPIVMVTSPADAGLGGLNPYASETPPGSSLTVRAIAFAPSGTVDLEARVGDGPWSAMAETARHVYEMTLVVPEGFSGGAVEVHGRAPEGEASDSAELLGSR